MKVSVLKIIVLLLLAKLALGCSSGDNDLIANTRTKNIILFIGDGMGTEHRKAARWFVAGETGKLSMDNMSARGVLFTRSANSTITDSAAAATAMATGFKTNNGVIALDANLNFVSTILEEAISQGKSVGLVTTTQVTHATSAAFASHIEDRNLMTEIAEQMLITGPDILLGGGEDEFLPMYENGCYSKAGERDDGRNLINEAIASGYVYVCDYNSFDLIDPSSKFKLIGLFSDEGMVRPFSPSLVEMTQKSINILSKNQYGFFLMIEAGQIDWASHDNDAVNAILDTVGLDEAVEVAKQFAAQENETLIIVTADHETGGMAVSSLPSGQAGEDGPFSTPDGSLFYVNWSTTGHTEAYVPVTSLGPSSYKLTGIKDNTYIYDVMSSAFSGM